MKALFENMIENEFEQIDFAYDPYSGLKAIIAIHDTSLGPALGGTRMMDYSTYEEALNDVLKLAKAMTYKNAAAGINFGGGKSIIIGDPQKDKDEALLRAFGKQLQSFGGRFITGVDIGTNPDDMVTIHQETEYNVALPESYGGPDSTSRGTAYGVFCGMKAMAQETFSDPDLSNKSIAVQGAGSVGEFLVEFLVEEGCEVTITDVDSDKINEIENRLNVNSTSPEKIYDLDVDIFSPNAVGGVLNDDTIPRLKCQMIAGAANNQLEDEEKHSKMLEERNILYGVDYILSAGGVINNANCFIEYDRERAYKNIEDVGDNIIKVKEIKEKNDITMVNAAQKFAENRLETASRLNKWHLPEEKKIKM